MINGWRWPSSARRRCASNRATNGCNGARWTCPGADQPGLYDVPSGDTFRRGLKQVNSLQLAENLIQWMKTQDPEPEM